MAFTLQTFREKAIQYLAKTKGDDLEISANLTNPGQFNLIIESYAHGTLGCEYTEGEKDLFLRITKSYNSKFGDYVVDIGKTPEYVGGSSSANNDL